MSASPLVLSLVSAFLVFFVYRYFSRSKHATQHRLPPGPQGLPILGNINDLPQPGILEAHHWLKHKDIYGPISSVKVMGQTLIIINDAALAFELMEKRSVIHSSRPKQIFAGEMLGWKNSLGLSPYNNHFRTYRKNMARIIGSSSSASQFNDLQEEEAGHFLLKVRDSPDDLQQHIRKEAGSLILKIAYGYNSEPHKSDPLIDMAGDAMDKFAKAGVPGAFLVDIFPFMRFLPDWFPGTAWKQTAKGWSAALLDVTERPYAFTKHQMSQGKHETSFLSRLLEAGAETPDEEWTNKWSAMSLYTAGADTVGYDHGDSIFLVLMFLDCVCDIVLLPSHDYEPRSPTYSTSGDRPRRRPEQTTHHSRSRQPALCQRLGQGSPTLAASCAHGLAAH